MGFCGRKVNILIQCYTLFYDDARANATIQHIPGRGYRATAETTVATGKSSFLGLSHCTSPVCTFQ